MKEQLTKIVAKLPGKLREIKTYQYLIFVLLFAKMTILAIDYGNAASEVYQINSFRGVNVLFGTIILITLSKKQLLSWVNLAFLPIWLVGSYLSYYQGWTKILGYEYYLYEEGLFQQVFKAGALVVLVWGIIIIAFLRKCITTKLKNFNLPLLFSWFLLVFIMLCFRYDKMWVFFFVGPLTLFYLQNYSKKMNLLLVKSMAGGLVVSFVYMVYLALRYRPFDLSRYPGMFSNPNNAGIYYGLVALVVFVMICNVWNRKKSVLKILQLVVLHLLIGSALCFLFFAASRTAILATFATFIFYYILQLVKKDNFWKLTGRLVLIVTIALIAINPIYFAIRYIPAYSNEPFMFESEYQYAHNMIEKDDLITSNKYTTRWEFFVNLAGKCGIDLNGLLSAEQKSNIDILKREKFGISVVDEEKVCSINDSGFTVREGDDYVSEDVLNGRSSIYEIYLERLNWLGHENGYIDLTSEIDEEGNPGPFIWHAHNTFLNMAYEFGIGGGIAFVVFVGLALFYSIKRYWKGLKEEEYLLFPCIIAVYFIASAIPEWVGFPMLPLALIFYLSIMPLFGRESQEQMMIE